MAEAEETEGLEGVEGKAVNGEAGTGGAAGEAAGLGLDFGEGTGSAGDEVLNGGTNPGHLPQVICRPQISVNGVMFGCGSKLQVHHSHDTNQSSQKKEQQSVTASE